MGKGGVEVGGRRVGVYAVLGDSRKDYVRTGWEKSKKMKSKVTQKLKRSKAGSVGEVGLEEPLLPPLFAPIRN